MLSLARFSIKRYAEPAFYDFLLKKTGIASQHFSFLHNQLIRLISLTIMTGRTKRKAATDDAAEVKAKKVRGETGIGHGLKWSNVGGSDANCSLIVLSSDTLGGVSKVAGFDIDFTVIKTASGRKFATGATDWEFWDEQVTVKLKQLNKDGYRVVFFTNQGGIEKKKVTPQTFKTKAEAIIKGLDIPVMVFASTGTNQYRKPYTGMWDYFSENCNQGVVVKKSESLYVGDAAGRAKNWAKDKPKDFSCCDRMFASNVGVKFYTPEEFFLNQPSVPFEWRSIDAKDFLKKNPAISAKDDKSDYASKKQEVIIMVGPPASGKSTFRQRYLEPDGYVVINRDTLGTMEKCLKIAREKIQLGKSIVADNTNPSASSRAHFISLAKEKDIPCRCIWLQTPLELAHHLNMFRQKQTKDSVRRVPDVGYNIFKKNFEEPTVKEGFTGGVIKVNFTPRFDNKTDEELFQHWTD
uniref:PNK FHA domain-containing protein n=2 Tax=Arion vulgaris TaxID=1028688 RepID=A0A0B7APD7_9EUPU